MRRFVRTMLAAAALGVAGVAPAHAPAMGVTGGEMLGETAAGSAGYVGGRSPKILPPPAFPGAGSLPLGNAAPPPTGAAGAAAPPRPPPCGNGAPPCK